MPERYRPVKSLGKQLRFLLDIQIPILEKYMEIVTREADQYERAGTGTAGLDKLCCWLETTQLLVETMRDWGEDIVTLRANEAVLS